MQTDAQKRATAKYRKAHKECISIMVDKGERDRWKAQAESHGMGLAEYIRHLVKMDK